MTSRFEAVSFDVTDVSGVAQFWAELLHLPQGRIGNILWRPNLREAEVCYLAQHSEIGARPIACADLLVALRNNRFTLWSQELGRAVVIRLSSAHDHSALQQLPLYRFLGALQHDGTVGGFGFSWGPFATMPHLPQVRFGRVVLSPEAWRLSADQLRDSSLKQLRKQFGIPRFVSMGSGDSQLVLDLASSESARELKHETKRNHMVQISELLPSPTDSTVQGLGGFYRNEVVIPFTRTGARSPLDTSTSRAVSSRAYYPGAAWLFLKLYVGAGLQRQVLMHVLSPLLERIASRNELSQWFFVRYADPDPHLAAPSCAPMWRPRLCPQAASPTRRHSTSCSPFRRR